MRIGILTITGGQNFGNRLQNYALQEVLKKYAKQVDTIRNYTKSEDDYKRISKMKKNIKWGIATLTHKLPMNRQSLNVWYRQRVFNKFNKDNIKFSTFIVSKDNVPGEISSNYDFFISGSDQVWNPHYSFNSHIDFMDFANEEQRISYAASFGVDEIPESTREQYKNWLNGIPYISVREERGRDIIKEITGNDVSVVIDPTLMLEQEQWETMMKKPKWLKYQNYILAYYLGEKAEKIDASVKDIALKYGLKIIYLNRQNLKSEYSTSPEEFLYLVKNCSLLCTDSFHGTIFAYQMKRPVVIYDRALMEDEVAMNSRMEMIQKLLGVENRIISYLDIYDKEKLFSCDYRYADTRIAEEREKAHIFLRKALRVDNE